MKYDPKEEIYDEQHGPYNPFADEDEERARETRGGNFVAALVIVVLTAVGLIFVVSAIIGLIDLIRRWL